MDDKEEISNTEKEFLQQLDINPSELKEKLLSEISNESLSKNDAEKEGKNYFLIYYFHNYIIFS